MTTDHRTMAEVLRARVGANGGETDAALRMAIARRVAGGPPIQEPYDALAHQIGEAAYRVTDAQVSAVRKATGSDKAAFEIVMAAAVAAGLSRWDSAMRALDEVSNAPK